MHHRDSYYQEYKRHHSKQHQNNISSCKSKLMTDRTSYMAFLEVELERVSAACMTVQAYHERLQQISTVQQEYDGKLKQFSRALKLTSNVVERNDADSNHKSMNLENRISNTETKMQRIENECQLLNADIPGLTNEVRSIVRKELLNITEKYNSCENRMNDMILERLGGYTDIYNTLENKLQSKLASHLSTIKQEFNEWNENILLQVEQRLQKYKFDAANATAEHSKNLQSKLTAIETNVNENIAKFEHQIFTEQPKYLHTYMTQKLASVENSAQMIKEVKCAQENAVKAEQLCSRIADDVYKRLQNQVLYFLCK